MTTYTVTVNNGSFTYYDQTAKQVKTLKTQYKNVKATKNIKTYYRGSEVKVIEERQLGWTLVHDLTNGGDRFAVTTELEYR